MRELKMQVSMVDFEPEITYVSVCASHEGAVTFAGAGSITLNIAGFAELMMISNILKARSHIRCALLRDASLCVAALCVAVRCRSKHCCACFRYEYSYVEKIWLTMMMMMMMMCCC